jgi:hypothetical protein
MADVARPLSTVTVRTQYSRPASAVTALPLSPAPGASVWTGRAGPGPLSTTRLVRELSVVVV